jgi:hypothetical protein
MNLEQVDVKIAVTMNNQLVPATIDDSRIRNQLSYFLAMETPIWESINLGLGFCRYTK